MDGARTARTLPSVQELTQAGSAGCPPYYEMSCATRRSLQLLVLIPLVSLLYHLQSIQAIQYGHIYVEDYGFYRLYFLVRILWFIKSHFIEERLQKFDHFLAVREKFELS